MNKTFLILAMGVTFLFFSSCEKNIEELDNEVLAAIIADMHISEITLKRYDATVKDSMQKVILEKLEIIHKISKDDIKFQVEHLMEDPKRQSEVYTLVIKKLQELEKEIKRKADGDIKKNRIE